MTIWQRKRKPTLWKSDFSGCFSAILRQISLEVRLYVCAHFPCLAKKTSPKNELRFLAEFPVKLHFLRLAVCIYSGGLEALSCEKTSPKNDLRFGLSFPNTASNFARSTDSTPSLIFLVLRKNITEKCAEVRAEFPEHGVKFRLKYACTSALIFLVLRKKHRRKMS